MNQAYQAISKQIEEAEAMARALGEEAQRAVQSANEAFETWHTLEQRAYVARASELEAWAHVHRLRRRRSTV